MIFHHSWRSVCAKHKMYELFTKCKWCLRSPILSLSPSLVALEMDSEEDDDDDILMKKPLPQPQPELKNSPDHRIMFKPAPDLTCTRSHSASSACNPTPAKVPHLFSLFSIVRQTAQIQISDNRYYTWSSLLHHTVRWKLSENVNYFFFSGYWAGHPSSFIFLHLSQNQPAASTIQ